MELFLLQLLIMSPYCCSSRSQEFTGPAVRVQKSPPATAGPVLQDHPFIVVWNMPTANCQKHNVQLDLEEFDIVVNRKQRFQGQKMTIFYRDRLGEYPYLSHDGRRMNGGLPQLGDLSAHLSLTVAQLSFLLRPNFSGLAAIDWEEWQPLWESNFGSRMEYRRLSKQLVRQERPDLLEKNVALLARQQFEESAQLFMEETLRLVVRNRPKGFWGFYGFPSCLNKHKRKTDKTYTGRCHKGTRKQNDRLSWLWTQSTALYPSIYLPERLAGSPDAALMVRHRLLEALRVASLWRHGNSTNHTTPVLPYARLAFTHTLNFLNKVVNMFKSNSIWKNFDDIQQTSVCVCFCVCARADRLGAHTRGERIPRSSRSCVVGRNEICQIQGKWEKSSQVVFMSLCVLSCLLSPCSNSASFSKTTFTTLWVHSCNL
uniref:Hyaluronidase n=1 Tax=Nothobranchius furzeri TaxID=105023 RepID=A0A8C6VRF2_NOTFU